MRHTEGGVVLLGAATAAGAYGPGQERTPARLRELGLAERLAAAVPALADLGDTPVEPFANDPARPDAQNVEGVRRAAVAVAERLAGPLASGAAAVVVGGDCTVQLGVTAAAARTGQRVGLVYVDLDADLNVPGTGDEGRLDWMGVAHLLDLPGCVDELADLGPRRPLLGPDDLRLLGVQNLTDHERAAIADRGLVVESADAVRADVDAVVDRTAAWASDRDLVVVHVDVDVLDADDLSVAQEVRHDVGGLSSDLLRRLVVGLAALPAARVLVVAEVNLDHASDPHLAGDWLISLVEDAVRP